MKQKKALISATIKLLDDYRLGLHRNSKDFADNDKITDALKSIIIDLKK